METPKRKVNKLSVTYRSSTPKKESNIQLDNDYSPLFMSNTQDCIDSVDVVWDWNSPQTKGTIKHDKKPPKRLYNSKPSGTSTTSPSNNSDTNQHNIPSFNKLKEQLECLRNQLILDNAEKCAKDTSINNFTNKPESPRRAKPTLPKPKNLLTKSFSSESLGSSLFEDDFNISDIVKQSAIPKNIDNLPQLSDSLDIDIALDEFQEEDYELLSQAISIKNKDTNASIKNVASKQICKTVESSSSSNKYMCRRSTSITNVSDVTKKYSQEEIEKKRKLALAKLEERRIDEVIEKKRQQALLRLESSRKKNNKIASTAIKRYNSS